MRGEPDRAAAELLLHLRQFIVVAAGRGAGLKQTPGGADAFGGHACAFQPLGHLCAGHENLGKTIEQPVALIRQPARGTAGELFGVDIAQKRGHVAFADLPHQQTTQPAPGPDAEIGRPVLKKAANVIGLLDRQRPQCDIAAIGQH